MGIGLVMRSMLSVAPCAGAWIEIQYPVNKRHVADGRPLRGGVD